MKKILLLSFMFVSVFSVKNTFASDREEIDILNQSNISLTEAIKIAEDNLNGKALEASIDDDAFSPVFEVKILKDNKVYDVKVDGKSKQVLGSREDRD